MRDVFRKAALALAAAVFACFGFANVASASQSSAVEHLIVSELYPSGAISGDKLAGTVQKIKDGIGNAQGTQRLRGTDDHLIGDKGNKVVISDGYFVKKLGVKTDQVVLKSGCGDEFSGAGQYDNATAYGVRQFSSDKPEPLGQI